MADERVQLKREEVVGNEVVMGNINPKTTTKSVDDSSTGARLDQTIDRMWNTINNKLSRIVNSVNGRTGVVVLRASDVGLGNVDNVSFGDIKEWVINQMNIMFGNKRIKLLGSLHDVDALIETNDEIYKDSPYFTEHGYNDDKKSYIGYIYLDPDDDTLKHTYLPINTVGYTDNSIIYDEKIGDKDFRGGGLSVNIWKYEDALEIYEGINKEDSGLRINREKLANGTLYHFEGMYGNGQTSDENALLYFDPTTTPTTATPVQVFIDDIPVSSNLKIRNKTINLADLIICDFKDYRVSDDNGVYSVPSGMVGELMCRNQCLGRVVTVPDEDKMIDYYRINFYSLKPNVGWGIQHVDNHKNGVNTSSELGIKLTEGTFQKPDGSYTSMSNMSGLQVYKSDTDPNTENISEDIKIPDDARITVLPQGPTNVFGNGFDGGLMITPDMSMCVIPQDYYSSESPNRVVRNWYSQSPNELVDMNSNKGSISSSSLIGVNLMKIVDDLEKNTDGKMRFANMSGLRVTSASDTIEHPSWYGSTFNDYMNEKNKYGGTTEFFADPKYYKNSGGLSVNVGDYLEIGMSTFNVNPDLYYDGGKVNVRIGKGLSGKNNRIIADIADVEKSLKLSDGLLEPFSAVGVFVNAGLIRDEEDQTISANISGHGLKIYHDDSKFTDENIVSGYLRNNTMYRDPDTDDRIITPVDENIYYYDYITNRIYIHKNDK